MFEKSTCVLQNNTKKDIRLSNNFNIKVNQKVDLVALAPSHFNDMQLIREFAEDGDLYRKVFVTKELLLLNINIGMLSYVENKIRDEYQPILENLKDKIKELEERAPAEASEHYDFKSPFIIKGNEVLIPEADHNNDGFLSSSVFKALTKKEDLIKIWDYCDIVGNGSVEYKINKFNCVKSEFNQNKIVSNSCFVENKWFSFSKNKIIKQNGDIICFSSPIKNNDKVRVYFLVNCLTQEFPEKTCIVPKNVMEQASSLLADNFNALNNSDIYGEKTFLNKIRATSLEIGSAKVNSLFIYDNAPLENGLLMSDSFGNIEIAKVFVKSEFPPKERCLLWINNVGEIFYKQDNCWLSLEANKIKIDNKAIMFDEDILLTLEIKANLVIEKDSNKEYINTKSIVIKAGSCVYSDEDVNARINKVKYP